LTRADMSNLPARECFRPLGDNVGNRLRATTAVLARALCETRDALTRIVATTLAIETVNGMAKTAPMTAVAMAKMLEAARTKG